MKMPGAVEKNEFGRTVGKQQNYDNLLNCMPRRIEGREGRGEKQNSDRWTGEAKKVRGNVANCQGKGTSKIPAHTKDEFKSLLAPISEKLLPRKAGKDHAGHFFL